MGARPVFHKDIGEALVAARKQKGWRQAQAADIARRRGLLLTRQSLRQLEEGRTKHPERETLQAVSDLYGLDYGDLVARFIESNYGLRVAASDAPPRRTLVIVEGDSERALFDVLQVLPAGKRQEIFDFVTFQQIRELPLDERDALLKDIRTTVQLARRGAVARSGARTAAVNQGSARRSPRKRRGA